MLSSQSKFRVFSPTKLVFQPSLNLFTAKSFFAYTVCLHSRTKFDCTFSYVSTFLLCHICISNNLELVPYILTQINLYTEFSFFSKTYFQPKLKSLLRTASFLRIQCVCIVEPDLFALFLVYNCSYSVMLALNESRTSSLHSQSNRFQFIVFFLLQDLFPNKRALSGQHLFVSILCLHSRTKFVCTVLSIIVLALSCLSFY